jgi:hypothetical protein
MMGNHDVWTEVEHEWLATPEGQARQALKTAYDILHGACLMCPVGVLTIEDIDFLKEHAGYGDLSDKGHYYNQQRYDKLGLIYRKLHS